MKKLILLIALISTYAYAGLDLTTPVPVSVKTIKSYNIISLEVDVPAQHIVITYQGLDGEEVLSTGVLVLSGEEYVSTMATMPTADITIYQNIAGVLYGVLQSKLAVSGTVSE